MDLAFSPEDDAFRAEVRAFIQEHLDPAVKAKMMAGEELTKEEYVAWQKTLHARGWMAPNWPVKYGGTGWTVTQKHIFEEEIALNWAPRQIPFGVVMVAPVIIEFGSDAQREKYLPRILDSTDWWCQGYSEPGSGSDLASLSCAAVRDGDHYVVNGQKTWITLAQFANMIFCLVRTNPNVKKQDGISFLLIDMTTPGVTVRPIITIDGGHEVNEVFFENVRVPAENLVGEEGGGWTYAKFLLEHERNGTAGIAGSLQLLDRLKAIAGNVRTESGTMLDDVRFARKMAEVEIELTALGYTQMRALAAESAGTRPGPESSYLKIKGTEIQQALSELAMEAAGSAAFEETGTSEAAWYFNYRKTSIYAGSNEIQRNIIAKRLLRL